MSTNRIPSPFYLYGSNKFVGAACDTEAEKVVVCTQQAKAFYEFTKRSLHVFRIFVSSFSEIILFVELNLRSSYYTRHQVQKQVLSMSHHSQFLYCSVWIHWTITHGIYRPWNVIWIVCIKIGKCHFLIYYDITFFNGQHRIIVYSHEGNLAAVCFNIWGTSLHQDCLLYFIELSQKKLSKTGFQPLTISHVLAMHVSITPPNLTILRHGSLVMRSSITNT